MSCQKPIVRVPQIVFVFVVFFKNLQPSNSWKQRQHIELLVSSFFLSACSTVVLFSFDFICAFVALNLTEMEKQLSVKGADVTWWNDDSQETCLRFFNDVSSPPESMF